MITVDHFSPARPSAEARIPFGSNFSCHLVTFTSVRKLVRAVPGPNIRMGALGQLAGRMGQLLTPSCERFRSISHHQLAWKASRAPQMPYGMQSSRAPHLARK